MNKELLPLGCFHIPLYKRFHFYLGIGAMLFLLFAVFLVSSYSSFLVLFPIALIVMYIIMLIGSNLYTVYFH
ncbi:membrane protein [gut metagenome]|uniref:Membrane protein n=1 Tax=gut metagenome TaxID=749906 RepID=J9H4F8_9ZZZZ